MNWKNWILIGLLVLALVAAVSGWTVVGKYAMDLKRLPEVVSIEVETAQPYNLELVSLMRQLDVSEAYNESLKREIKRQAREIEQLRRELTIELADVWGSRDLRDFKNKEELMMFIMEDKTDQMVYVGEGDYKYVCSHYSMQLMRNAADKGYRMYPALVFTMEGNYVTALHMMNFAVVDTYLVPAGEFRRTIVGIEPMTDEIILLGCLYEDKAHWRVKWYPFLP